MEKDNKPKNFETIERPLPDAFSELLPFVEKYRPSEFKDIISHTDILAALDKFNFFLYLYIIILQYDTAGKTSTFVVPWTSRNR
jgi:hypothetical protein